jgi:hypothetical protein
MSQRKRNHNALQGYLISVGNPSYLFDERATNPVRRQNFIAIDSAFLRSHLFRRLICRKLRHCAKLMTARLKWISAVHSHFAE